MSLTIRPAFDDDLPLLHEIERACFPRSPWEIHQMLEDDCIVAEWDGQVAGFLMSRQVLPALSGKPAEREILNVAVAPRFRRLGLATALLKHEIQKRMAHQFLEVRESNAAARTLYRKLGFVDVGRRVAYYQDPDETAIVMNMKWC